LSRLGNSPAPIVVGVNLVFGESVLKIHCEPRRYATFASVSGEKMAIALQCFAKRIRQVISYFVCVHPVCSSGQHF
jgi:hypothetical protein